MMLPAVPSFMNAAIKLSLRINGVFVPFKCTIENLQRFCRPLMFHDVAPKFYPVLSSFPGLDLPCWAGDTAGDGAELFALRSARARRGLKVEANSAGVCHPSCD
jgi:hypothetical protein